MLKNTLLIIGLMIINVSVAQTRLEYYLPEPIEYDDEITKPNEYLGFEVGSWHVMYEQLIGYLKLLSTESTRISMEEYARTYENRPLYLITISSQENQQNIQQIQNEHLKLSDPQISEDMAISGMPIVVWLGYSVHGNESSGSNAALLVAYHLAAAHGSEIENMLENTVILLDPCINPDGLNRFAHWANTNKSKNPVADPYDREHNEPWPNGRTNHYWFDLNRDWLPVQHPETQGRLKKFHEWKPNLLTDHHEMGTNSTFFFQPGIPSRNHPITPESTYALTAKVAEFHAEALDELSVLYYSKESFDDFYYGKGSTYPDVNGAVGILFEQASSRGHVQESVNGTLTFPFTIKNQFQVSLSTLKAAQHLKDQFLNHQRDFYKNSLSLSKAGNTKAYVVSASKDQARLDEFTKILLAHQIKVFHSDQQTNDNRETKQSLIIPTNQPQYRLIKALFEQRTTFTDSLFYDISTWTLPLAFNLSLDSLDGKAFTDNMLGNEVKSVQVRKGTVLGGKSDYAYLFEWNDYYTPKLLYQLLANDLIVKVSARPLQLAEGNFTRGAIILPVGLNEKRMDSGRLFELLQQLSSDSGIDVYALQGGLSQNGISLGSPNISSLQKPRICMLVGRGVSTYESGEVWHLLDQRFDIPVTRITHTQLDRVNLEKYNTMILVNGNYGSLNATHQNKIKSWIQNGGNIIAIKNAVKWLASAGLSASKFKKKYSDTSSVRYPYQLVNQYQDAHEINGAIFQGTLDVTHPLCFGYQNPSISIFKNSTLFMEPLKSHFANPVVYTDTPLLSGYISTENLRLLKNTASVSVSTFGQGKIVAFADNPNFRAFWYGTNKLFLNSIFFTPIISKSSTR